MDYEMIDRIMVAKSLSTNPAFDDLRIALEPMPNLNGCPLGLYYPGTATIALPLDATDGALLHELGHRHGHFYYDDLSERYAENFRRRYQKGRALLYMGNDFTLLPRLGSLFEEGERGAVEIALFQRLTPDELYEIKGQLCSYGEPPPKVCCGNSEVPWVRFEFTRGVDWMVIIGSVVAGVVVLTAASLGYALYKTAKELPWIVPVSLFGFGAYLVLKSAAGEVRRLAAKRY